MKLYSNPNAWRRTIGASGTTRRLTGLLSGNDLEALRINSEHRELVALAGERLGCKHLQEVIKAMPLMRARKDKRRRPRRVSKEVFKTYRRLKLK